MEWHIVVVALEPKHVLKVTELYTTKTKFYSRVIFKNLYAPISLLQEAKGMGFILRQWGNSARFRAGKSDVEIVQGLELGKV